uniref:Amidohydrolase n=2 Tax=Bacillus cereus TaxID=1396 RepID=J8CNL8_BACCE|nr:amidohydrolase [Bacillus cereus HuA4-10]
MAGANRFSFTIYGKGGHGSMPHQTIDPTLVISNIITQLQSIVSRNLESKEQAVVSIGELRSGSNYNVIPHTAYASGTVRYFDIATSKLTRKRVETIIKGVCDSFGATFELSYEHGDPPLLNDKKLTTFMKKKATEIFGEDYVAQIDPIMGSEDFAYYSTKIPASYTFIGIGKPSHPYGHHHPKFDIDEEMLSVGVELFTNSLLDYLKGEE